MKFCLSADNLTRALPVMLVTNIKYDDDENNDDDDDTNDTNDYDDDDDDYDDHVAEGG